MNGGPHDLVSSPLPFYSTLMTYAPISVNIIDANEPTSIREQSTILICFNILLISIDPLE